MKTFHVGRGEFVWNGLTLSWGGINSVPFKHEPSVDEVVAILAGWDAGYEAGKQDGRKILQNDFRNLMGLPL